LKNGLQAITLIIVTTRLRRLRRAQPGWGASRRRLRTRPARQPAGWSIGSPGWGREAAWSNWS